MATTATRTVLAALLLVLAGCFGLSPAETPDSTDGPSPGGQPQDISTPTPLPNVSVSAVTDRAVDAMAAAETYAVNGSVSRTLQLPTGTVESSVTTTGRVNRSARTLFVAETTTGHMQHLQTETYVENGTAYQRYVNYEAGGNATWHAEAISPAEFRLLDPLARQTRLVENASVSVRNRTTLRGEPVYVAYADVEESAYTSMYDRVLWGQPMNVTEITFKYYTHRETGQLLQMQGLLQGVANKGNGTAVLTEEYELSFEDYGADVTVDVPSNATAGP